MKTLVFLVALCIVMSVAFGSKGISVKIPLPFIKIRFIDIAQLFGDKHHGGGIELGGHHGGFGLDIGGGGGGHHY